MPPTTLFRSVFRPQRPFQNINQISRPFSQTSRICYAKKGAEDRESINTESSEHSKSATDAEAAQQDKAAYDPNTTSPEGEMEAAGDGKKGSGNPLEVSGANSKSSQTVGEQAGGAEKSPKEGGRQSGGGSPAKGQKL